MSPKNPIVIAAVLFLALVLPPMLATPVHGQIAGFKLSTPNVGNTTPTGEDATFDVIAYGNTPTVTSSAQLLAGAALNNYSSTSFTNSYNFGNGVRPYLVQLYVNSQWNWGDYPAISYGDGQIRQIMALALDPLSVARKPSVDARGPALNTFRGTFTHTYTPGNYTIKSRLTPEDELPLANPGVPTTGTLFTGNASVGTLANTFTYRVTVSPLSPPGTSTYNYQNTAISNHTYPSTVRQIWNTEQVEIGGLGPALTVTGSCPGMATIDITGLTPFARMTFWASDTAGSTPIGEGPCASVNVDLDVVKPRRRDFADMNGEYSFTRFFFFGQCNIMMQAVNHGTCTKSPVVTGVAAAPIAPPLDEGGGFSLSSFD